MSTSSKIFQNQLEVDRKSPRRSFNLSTSPHLTPRSKNSSSSSGNSAQYDQEQLLKLEIRQIKRENKFLKKKVQELISQINGDKPVQKKSSKMGKPKEEKDVTQITVDFFFDQLNSLINTLVDLFKVQFSLEQVKKFSDSFPDENNDNPVKKFTALKKFTLNRKLSKIMLQKEEKRYPLLLQVFMNYYYAKEQSQIYIRKVVDKLTTKALQLNKLVVQKAHKKAHKAPRSHHHFEYQDNINSKNKMHSDDFNLPWKFGKIGSPNSEIKNNQRQKDYQDAHNQKKITSPRKYF